MDKDDALLRQSFIDMTERPAISEEVVQDAVDSIMRWSIDDMPQGGKAASPAHFRALVGDILTLLDAIGMKHQKRSRNDSWKVIGMQSKDARGILGGKIGMLRWPVFFTLRETALAVTPQDSSNEIR